MKEKDFVMAVTGLGEQIHKMMRCTDVAGTVSVTVNDDYINVTYSDGKVARCAFSPNAGGLWDYKIMPLNSELARWIS